LISDTATTADHNAKPATPRKNQVASVIRQNLSAPLIGQFAAVQWGHQRCRLEPNSASLRLTANEFNRRCHLTYLVARRAVQNWRELCILLFAVGAMITIANLLGLEQSIDFEQSKISFRPTVFDNLTVLISATIMLIHEAIRRLVELQGAARDNFAHNRPSG